MRLKGKTLKRSILDSIGPFDLTDQQLTVGEDLNFFYLALAGAQEPLNHGPVLGDIIRGVAKRVGCLRQQPPLSVKKRIAPPGGAWIV